ncbi:hypothetical protein N657DRAFT_648937 [Parathielavia appendiculata]|uniref:Uncharacterized protein n=1 Tax=Parathielavia appendiculata TaxID=2587402 RepID=A0AAN6Z0G7_9PEZI|nr:hypothetical protein N657DRAFT_648937 [Parathielavia appendiculata]
MVRGRGWLLPVSPDAQIHLDTILAREKRFVDSGSQPRGHGGQQLNSTQLGPEIGLSWASGQPS